MRNEKNKFELLCLFIYCNRHKLRKMDCLKLLETLDVLGCAGICISTENSQLLQNSLLILQTENHFRKCYYWGRINGLQNDYHIAYGYEKDCMNGRVYHYR